MPELTLHDIILAHVVDNSGGIKFTELLAKLTAIAIENSEQLPENFQDMVEETIRKSDKMKILDYTFTTLKRVKMFVYTP